MIDGIFQVSFLFFPLPDFPLWIQWSSLVEFFLGGKPPKTLRLSFPLKQMLACKKKKKKEISHMVTDVGMTDAFTNLSEVSVLFVTSQ